MALFPPLFSTLFADNAVKGIFGSTPLRVYAFGDAPHKGGTGYAVPYAIFQTITGSPENYLGQRPDLDQWTVQVDVYGASLTAARNGAEAIRYALEVVAYISGYNLETWDTETKLFRYSMDVSFQTPRA